MRESYWGYWLVILGVFIIGVMLLVNNISTTNTNDYYNIKEVTQAAMIDAVDYSYYRLYGSVKMSEQKFVENFIRRFAENVNPSNTYKIDFYDLYEVPPKVSVKISTNSSSFNVGNSLSNNYDVTNTLTAILELGVSDGSDKPINNTDAKTCEVFAYNSLMQFFQDGKKVAGLDGKEYNYLYWEGIDDFSIEVTREEVIKRKYSFSAGTYFEVQIEHVEISPEEFKKKMNGFLIELDTLSKQSKELSEILKKRLESLHYEG